MAGRKAAQHYTESAPLRCRPICGYIIIHRSPPDVQNSTSLARSEVSVQTSEVLATVRSRKRAIYHQIFSIECHFVNLGGLLWRDTLFVLPRLCIKTIPYHGITYKHYVGTIRALTHCEQSPAYARLCSAVRSTCVAAVIARLEVIHDVAEDIANGRT